MIIRAMVREEEKEIRVERKAGIPMWYLQTNKFKMGLLFSFLLTA
jgi:hypothetical protein